MEQLRDFVSRTVLFLLQLGRRNARLAATEGAAKPSARSVTVVNVFADSADRTASVMDQKVSKYLH